MNSTGSSPFRVLSLDGGGMRGTYTATYLERLGGSFASRRGLGSLDIGAAFDLIVGTSTGGIVACALAAGIPLSEIVDLYITSGPRIFSQPLPKGAMRVVPDTWKRPPALEAGSVVLREVLLEKFGETTLGEIYEARGIALAIPAVEMSQHRSWVFKTPHLRDMTNHRDDKYTLVDICLATTAAPIYRSMVAIDHPDSSSNGFNVFVDGGLWANNPVLTGLIDALDLTDVGQEVQIFCLGTCPIPTGEQIAKSELNRSLSQWKFGGEAANLAIDAQQFAYDHMAKKLARHVKRDCKIVRFPSENVPAALVPFLQLDETRAEAMQALINQARTDADMTNARCGYADTDTEAGLICSLFDSIPPRTHPLASKASPAYGSASG